MQPIVTAPVTTRLRLDAIDFVRGIVMILMVLDHTRDWVHAGGIMSNPLDPATTTILLYVTRWVTHLCAPTFALLAGLGVGLRRIRGATAGDVSWFLFTRGLWLVVLELTLFRTIVWFNVDFRLLAFLQVIWAIGASMIVLSALVRLPQEALVAIAGVILIGHNALDGIRVPFWTPGSNVPVPGLAEASWMLLHQFGLFPVGGASGPIVIAQYPLLPTDRRRRTFLVAGVTAIVAFVALRASNAYGDPHPWTGHDDPVRTVLSFLDCEKYPPSLLFVLMTLGPALCLLAWMDRPLGPWATRVAVYGRVPLFYYVLHLILIHAATIALAWPSLGAAALLHRYIITGGLAASLPAVYVLWIAVVLTLYPACAWFADVKRRSTAAWMSYL